MAAGSAAAGKGWPHDRPAGPAGIASRAARAALAARPGGEPWRRRAFLSGQAVSLLGYGLAALAIPLLVLDLSRSPLISALSAASVTVGYLMVGLPAGVLVDRLDAWRVLLVTDALRAVLFAALFGFATAGLLSVWLVLAIAFLGGSAQAGRKSDALPPPQGGAVSLGTTDLGSMGFARASGDSNQLVRCDIMAHDDDPVNPTPGWTSVRCTFIDVNGNAAMCVSMSQAIIRASTPTEPSSMA